MTNFNSLNSLLDQEFTLVGLTIENYIGQSVEGSNCKFTYSPTNLQKYHFHLLNEGYNKIVLSVWKTYGECFSGWTTASWGHYELSTDKKIPITHRYNRQEKVKIIQEGTCGYALVSANPVKDNRRNILSFSETGGDDYYPCGRVFVNLDYFTTSKRYLDNTKPILYVFIGDSGVGKSNLAFLFQKEVKVWDFDAGFPKDNLATYKVLVLGNKNKLSFDEVVSKIDTDLVNIVKVDFTRI